MTRHKDEQPNPALDKEPAEGSRETVDEALNRAEHPEHRSPDIDPPLQLPDEGEAGAEEEQEQAELPPPDTRKRE